MNDMFIEACKLIGILLAIIIMYVLSGIANSVLVRGEEFSVKALWSGIIKAVIACLSLVVLAFVSSSDLIDLSGIGFQPKTFISSGIMLYGSKLLKNISALIGVGNGAAITSAISDSTKKAVDDILNAKKEDTINNIAESIEEKHPKLTPVVESAKEDIINSNNKDNTEKKESSVQCESCEYKKTSSCNKENKEEVKDEKIDIKEESTEPEIKEEFIPDPNAVG